MSGHRIPLVSILLALAFGCGGDKPLKPKPTELRIYIGGIDYSQPGPARSVLFVYDYDSLTVLDSMPLPAPSVDAAVSDDGRSIFVATTNDLRTRSIWKIDTKSKQAVWHTDLDRWPESSESAGRLHPLNDGRWLVLNRTVVATSDGRLVKTLPDTLAPFGGPPSGTRIALGILLNQYGAATALTGHDLAADTSWGMYYPHLESGAPFALVYTAVLHPDLRRILVIGYPMGTPFAGFVIGDLLTGETLMQHELIYPGGEIVISPSGSVAAVSDPSVTLIHDSAPTLDIFDLDSLRHRARFTWGPWNIMPRCWPGQLAWVPGADAVVAASPGDLLSAGANTVVDVRRLQVVGSFYLPGRSEQFEYITGGLAVGVASPSH